MRQTLEHEPRGESVAQVSNLLYRRFPIGRMFRDSPRSNACGAGGLEIRDTAQRGQAATKMDRGCGRRPSRSALESRPCCGWCCARRAPKIRRGLHRFWAILIDWKSALPPSFTPRAAPAPIFRPGAQPRGDRIVSNVPCNSGALVIISHPMIKGSGCQKRRADSPRFRFARKEVNCFQLFTSSPTTYSGIGQNKTRT